MGRPKHADLGRNRLIPKYKLLYSGNVTRVNSVPNYSGFLYIDTVDGPYRVQDKIILRGDTSLVVQNRHGQEFYLAGTGAQGDLCFQTPRDDDKIAAVHVIGKLDVLWVLGVHPTNHVVRPLIQ